MSLPDVRLHAVLPLTATSECKPCPRQRTSDPEVAPSPLLSLLSPPACEDVLMTATEEKDSSAESDYEDLGVLSDDIIALQGTNYFRDLQEGESPLLPLCSALSISICPDGTCQQVPVPHASFLSTPVISVDSQQQDKLELPAVTLTVNIPRGLGDPAALVDMDPDVDVLPGLVRSMSVSRRHSWGVPVSPMDMARRLSLDSSDLETDGGQENPPSSLDRHHPLPFSYPQCPPQPEKEVSSCTGSELEPELDDCGQSLRLCSDVLLPQRSRTVHVLTTSKQAAVAVEGGQELEDRLQTEEGQSHMLLVQKVLQELRQYHGAKQRSPRKDSKETSSNVTWYEFLSKENEEEEDQVEKVERGTKVKRTLSSLKNRVTGSFNKDKGKSREKEPERDREKVPGSGSGHQLVPGTFSSLATCSVCCRSLQRKHGLQCLNCAVNVHRSCRNLLPECTTSKVNRPTIATGLCHLPPPSVSAAQKEASHPDTPEAHRPTGSPRGPGMTITPRGCSTQPATPGRTCTSPSGSLPKEMDDLDAFRIRPVADDSISLSTSTSDSFTEDVHYSDLQADLEADAQDLELDSWSLVVDQQYLQTFQKTDIKRQDVIYELMQTEMHHVRMLKIMLGVYVHEMRESLQMDRSDLERLFPQLEDLLEVHGHFLSRLRQRRRESLEPCSERNYVIQQLGDILVSQFSGDIGGRMRRSYSKFCSHHQDAVSFYKEQFQNSKKFQSLMRKLSNLSIVRRLGVPECVLLVTQRITKYPILLERLLQYTEDGTEEHDGLVHALDLIRDVLVFVDMQVGEYEKEAHLRDLANRMEPRCAGKLKDGHLFRREDLTKGGRKLLHKGPVSWKAASGRLKDILAVLLSDVLLLLQEKDQKFTFSTVDNKPSVIYLRKLIVREVAHEEKAMFLICTSSVEPEMYEIHTVSKEERSTWMSQIRQAVENCPNVNKEPTSEEDKAQSVMLQEFQVLLHRKDQQVVQSLTEKLEIFVELAKVLGMEDTGPCPRLLLRGDNPDLQRGEQLLSGAITEVENLQSFLVCNTKMSCNTLEEDQSVGGAPRRAETFCDHNSSPTVHSKNASAKSQTWDSQPRARSQRSSSDPQLKYLYAHDDPEQLEGGSQEYLYCLTAQLFTRVHTLSQILYSLQAEVSQQDSQKELQRARQMERERPGRTRTSTLLEQEKQRNLEKQREELASFQRLQSEYRQERERWEQERDRQRRRTEAAEAALRGREETCRALEARLERDRKALQERRAQYQQDLERLRESTRAVERDRERLEQQQLRFHKHTTAANPGQLTRNATQALPHVTMVNGELPSGGRDLFKPARSPQDPERPEVPPRRESIGLPPTKSEVPIHLLSTTNQLAKQREVQQQIPTKLALHKEKSGKARGAQRAESSASASLRVLEKEDRSLRGRRPGGSFYLQGTDGVNSPRAQVPHTARSLRQAPPPSRPPTDDDSSIIFF
ncbi:rho guanine nucleotide exchange factor 18-like [Arapaima gigas]